MVVAIAERVIEIGQSVGNYMVNAQLGEGGMGVVYLAEHPVIGRKVALKVIHPEYARNLEVVSRFITEAKAVNQIGHDHIVDITDFGTTPAGDFYFIMEYLDGVALGELIQRGPRFAPERALRICAQIADALQASHDHGVIHRDLKPDNIFLVPHGDDPDFVKVLDFGLAKLVNPSPAATPTHNTGVGLVLGTPYYMSPEQCEGIEIDHRADIYALGVILFEMLTGEVPFGGNSYRTIMLNQMTKAPPAARRIVPELPPALDAILSRALAKRPADRFQSMAELRAALLDPSAYAPSAADGRLRPAPRPRRGTLLLAAGAAAAVVLTTTEYRRPVAHVVAAAHALGRPATVRVNFNSDPAGATVAREDGLVLGLTPLSTTVPFAETPQRYLVSKEGFRSTTVSIVPNLPSPVFAVLPPEAAPEPPALAAPQTMPAVWATAGRRPASRAHRSHDKPRQSIAASIDEDAVLPPSLEE
jgi:tRNA A-37 threonylcarbamoyl transferase component Bud32